MNALTGLRGLAALWVLLYHAWVFAIPRAIVIPLPLLDALPVHPIFATGWAGVQLLFVLSAFLLTGTLMTRQSTAPQASPLAGYFRRRIARVFPAYWLQIGLLLPLLIYAGRMSMADLDAITLANYAIMNFIPPPIGEPTAPINGVLWTLPVELLFYGLLPWLRWGFALSRVGWLLAVGVAISSAWKAFSIDHLGGPHASVWFSQLPGSLDAFAAGIAGAVFAGHSRDWPAESQRRLNRWLPVLVAMALLTLLGLIAWMDLAYLEYRQHSAISYLWTPLFSLACATVVVAAARGQRMTEWLFGNRLLVGLGTISYGLYLWHLPLITLALARGWLAPTANGDYLFPALAGYALLGAAFFGWLSWRYCERPAIAWAKKTRPQRAGS